MEKSLEICNADVNKKQYGDLVYCLKRDHSNEFHFLAFSTNKKYATKLVNEMKIREWSRNSPPPPPSVSVLFFTILALASLSTFSLTLRFL